MHKNYVTPSQISSKYGIKKNKTDGMSIEKCAVINSSMATFAISASDASSNKKDTAE